MIDRRALRKTLGTRTVRRNGTKSRYGAFRRARPATLLKKLIQEQDG